AVLGWGVWSLAWGAVVQQMYRSVELYARIRHAWLPSTSRAAFRRLFSFGAAELSVNVAGYGAANADYAIVARLLGEGALGYYSRAYQLMSVPVNQFSRTISGVLFTSFASIHNRPERLRQAFAGCLALTAITAFPTLSILAVLAPEAIRGILGPAWQPAIAPLQSLCFAGVFLSIFAMGDALARAEGVAIDRAVRDIVYFAAIVVASLAGSKYGIDGVAVGVALACAVPYVWTAILVQRALSMKWSEFLAAQAPGAALAMLAGVICLALSGSMRFFGLPDLAVLAASATLSGAAIAGLLLVLPDRVLGPAAAWAIARVKARLGSTVLKRALGR
ncbi:MAG TPA: oligosaccharide flippase family protein, partial [Sphingomonadaceae bacterium]|nr:oligosaccharide flippase family protein [Sphingomonadaceae bacterium]